MIICLWLIQLFIRKIFLYIEFLTYLIKPFPIYYFHSDESETVYRDVYIFKCLLLLEILDCKFATNPSVCRCLYSKALPLEIQDMISLM